MRPDSGLKGRWGQAPPPQYWPAGAVHPTFERCVCAQGQTQASDLRIPSHSRAAEGRAGPGHRSCSRAPGGLSCSCLWDWGSRAQLTLSPCPLQADLSLLQSPRLAAREALELCRRQASSSRSAGWLLSAACSLS